MKKEELKLRIISFINKTLDMYIPRDSASNKLKNSTIKLWMEQNICKIDPFLDTFVEIDGNINSEHIISHYENTLFENNEFKVDVRDLIPDEYSFIKRMLPNKMILFKKNDLTEIFGTKIPNRLCTP